MTTLGTSGPRGARSEDVRRRNLGSVLRHVHVHGPTQRSRLTSLLGLNRSTIGDLTGELVESGLVREEPGDPAETRVPGASGPGGRPSHVVRPETERVQVLAVDVGVTHLTVARVGLGGHVLARRQLRRDPGPQAVRDVVRTVGLVARHLLDEAPGVPCPRAGAAVPGMVRGRDGLVRLAPNLEWTDVPFGSLLGAELGMPVLVGNDADLGVLAEHVRGAALGCVDVVYLAGHSGIGAGVLVGGRPLSGRDGYAGEVGHVVVNPDGAACHCGSRGCWETECGEERLFELAGRPAGGGLDAVREVATAAANGDADAAGALAHVATWLGRGTGNIVNLFNPEVVIMGGALAQVLAAAPDTVHAQVTATALDAPRESARILPPAFGLDSSLVGAAELAFEPLLTDPLHEMSRLAAS